MIFIFDFLIQTKPILLFGVGKFVEAIDLIYYTNTSNKYSCSLYIEYVQYNISITLLYISALYIYFFIFFILEFISICINGRFLTVYCISVHYCVKTAVIFYLFIFLFFFVQQFSCFEILADLQLRFVQLYICYFLCCFFLA